MKATLDGLTAEFGRDGIRLTVTTDIRDEEAVKAFLNEYNKDTEYTIQIKEKGKARRSISANAFLWEIIGKIARVLVWSTKEEIYRHIIQQAGVYSCLSVDRDALLEFQREWEEQGTGWFIELLSPMDEKELDIACYYGTSTYDSAEMARCIDFALEEARDLGIELPPRKEIETIKHRWKTRPNGREKRLADA